mmetsp:Transcript_98404/g.195119  ORF Transcript_98404/g.195119 Transcript_98404/m.195119 type:complete len:216 (+) Transcript_98404:3164-3811(+)
MVIVSLLRQFLWLHFQCIIRAHLHANCTSSAVIRCNLNGVVQATQLASLAFSCLVSRRSDFLLFLVQEEGTDDSMRADYATKIALRALVGKPYWDLFSKGTLLMKGLTNGCLASGEKCAYGQIIASAAVNTFQKLGAEFINPCAVLTQRRMEYLQRLLCVFRRQPFVGVRNSVEIVHCSCQSCLVGTHNVRTFLAIETVHGCLELFSGIFGRQNV